MNSTELDIWREEKWRGKVMDELGVDDYQKEVRGDWDEFGW